MNELVLWLEWKGVMLWKKFSVIYLLGYMILDGFCWGDGIFVIVKMFIVFEIENGIFKVLFEEGIYLGIGYYLIICLGVKCLVLKVFFFWIWMFKE